MTRRNLGCALVAGAAGVAGLAGVAPPVRAAHRLAPRVEELQRRAAQFLEEFAEELHHQGHNERAAIGEIQALMAAGTAFGQARAFRLLLEEQGRDAQLVLAWRQVAASLDEADERVRRAHLRRSVLQSWQRVMAMAADLDQDLDRDRRGWPGRGRDRVFE